MTVPPLLLWFRRDLRLADHPMLAAAVASGQPLVPVFVLDPETEAIGAASKWRLGLAVAAFAERLAEIGLRLVLRRGAALDVLRALVAETGASGVHWSRQYDPASRARDTAVKARLREAGIQAVSHPGHLLHEPWTVETGEGGFYRVYSPYWRAVRDRDVPAPLPAPGRAQGPGVWPVSDRLDDWRLGAAMRRGAAVVAPYLAVGENAAAHRLAAFLDGPVEDYRTARDYCDRPTTSRLSENLTYGEIGPRTIWHAGMAAHLAGAGGAEHFLKELVWREFAWHLMHHTPHIATRNWRDDWDSFPWRADNADAERWRRGMTGEPFVDAAMREMYVTGTMHNRGRMIVASYLTKHLMTDWRVGLRWFEECLVDWDPAANAMGWQWTAGSGPDAAPYFRVFNPATQAEKFDGAATYRHRWIAELSASPPATALAFFDAVPRVWHLDPGAPYPAPMIDLGVGRERALAAYAARNS
ncbi:MAG: deoxyribodipyrimidine photo-lyase [Paracoccaceae bacterium]|nr:MAG: deoxyribodipyrimidine photo-lyase [Paracoccaceae bacterium]